MTTTSTPERSVAAVESELTAAKLELVEAEAAAAAAWTKVDESRADHAVGRLVKAVLLGHQRQLAAAQSRVGDLEWKIKGLERLGTELREAEALELARARSRAIRGFEVEAAALETWTADVIAGTIDAFERIDSAFAELHQRSGGKLGGRTKGPADMRRVHGALIASLHELRRHYSNTTNGG